jgi:hypothetical protein
VIKSSWMRSTELESSIREIRKEKDILFRKSEE